jgi:hypothetical protein
VFGVVAGVFLFHEKLNYIYFIAFSLTMLGVAVYNSYSIGMPSEFQPESATAMLTREPTANQNPTKTLSSGGGETRVGVEKLSLGGDRAVMRASMRTSMPIDGPSSEDDPFRSNRTSYQSMDS